MSLVRSQAGAPDHLKTISLSVFMTERYLGWLKDQSYIGILQGYKLDGFSEDEKLQALLEAAVDARDPKYRADKLAKALGLTSKSVFDCIRSIKAVELSHHFTSGA